MSPSPPRWILPAILALAAALRLLAWHGAVVMTNDGPDFLWQAGRLLEGDLPGALSHPYHPLYAAATALATPLARSVLHAALAVSILSALSIVLAVRALAARLFPGQRAVPEVAALLAAVHGRLAITTSDIQSDGLFLALVALAFATLLAASERGGCRRRLALAGLLTGLAYLARPEGLFLVGVAVLWWLVAVTRRAPSVVAGVPSASGASGASGVPGVPGVRAASAETHATGHSLAAGPRPDVVRASTGLACFLVGTAVCVLPYVWALHDLSGRWGLSLKPSFAAVGLSEAGAEWALPAGCPLASPVVYRAPAGAVTAMPEGVRRTAEDAGASGATASSLPAASTDDTQIAATEPPAAPAAHGAHGARVDPGVDTSADAEDRDDDATTERGALAALLPSVVHAAAVLIAALRVDTALLSLVGLALLWRSRRGMAKATLALVGAWFVIAALHSWLSHGLSARHTLLATVLLLPLAGAGLVRLWTLAGAWRAARTHGSGTAGRRVAGVSLRIALVLVLAAHAVAGVRPRHVGSEPRLAALAWAAQHTQPGQRLAVERRKDSFYSGRPVLEVALPCFDAELLDKLTRHDVALLVLDEQSVQRAAPHWLTGGRFVERARFGSGSDTVLVLALVRD